MGERVREMTAPQTFPQCELPQGMVGTPRCTKPAEHVADIHGCLLEQPEHEWIRVQVCFDHIVAGHKEWTRAVRSSISGQNAVCTDCRKKFTRFADMFRRVGDV